jgi:hypothetical protein
VVECADKIVTTGVDVEKEFPNRKKIGEGFEYICGKISFIFCSSSGLVYVALNKQGVKVAVKVLILN